MRLFLQRSAVRYFLRLERFCYIMFAVVFFAFCFYTFCVYFFCFLMQILRQIWPFFNRFWPKKPKFSRKNLRRTVFSFFNGFFQILMRFFQILIVFSPFFLFERVPQQPKGVSSFFFSLKESCCEVDAASRK